MRQLSSAIFLTLAAVASPSLVAQAESLRKPTRVQLFRADGSPWAGATLQLVGWPHTAYTWAGEPDRVVAKSDERGTVRLKLLPGMQYGGYASERIDEMRHRTSKVLRTIAAGQRLEIGEERTVMRNRIEFSGIEELGELELWVEGVYGVHPFEQFDVEPGKGILLPPWTQMRWELRQKGGAPIYAMNATLRDALAVPPGQQLPPLKSKLLNWTRVRVEVKAPDGTPLAGAKIRDSLYTRDCVLATSGEDGVAEFLTRSGLVRSKGKRSFSCSFVVDHPEHALLDVRSRVSVAEPAEGSKLFEAKVEAKLPKSETRVVRVLGVDGEPWAGLTLHVRSAVKKTRGTSSYYPWHVLVTDSNGEVRLRVAEPGRAVRLVALPRPAELAALRPDRRASDLAPLIWLADAPLPAETQFDARRFTPLTIEVLARDGRPLRSPRIYVEGSAQAKERRAGLSRLATYAGGRTGRLVMLRAPEHGGPNAAMCQMGFRSVTATLERSDAEQLRLKFVSDDRRVSGVLRDAEGKPVPFASLRVYWRGNAQGVRVREGRPQRTSLSVTADAHGQYQFFAPRNSRLQITATHKRQEGEEIFYLSSERLTLNVPEDQESGALAFDVALEKKTKQGQRKLQGGVLVAPGGGARIQIRRAVLELEEKKEELEEEAEKKAKKAAEKAAEKAKESAQKAGAKKR